MAHKAKSLFLVLYKPSWLASGLSETLMIFPPLAEGKGTEQTMDWHMVISVHIFSTQQDMWPLLSSTKGIEINLFQHDLYFICAEADSL